MIDALLRERVAQFCDIPAILDPLNRDALMDGPFRSLTWPELDEQVSRLAQVLLDAGIGTGDVVGVQRDLGIATFKLPERLEIRESLPRNPLGKILKRESRDELRH